MAALYSPSSPQNPPQTFLDKKPPLLPRQSTSDVLSFTHIIANRLAPGQNVWDFFSPAESAPPPPPPPPATPPQTRHAQSPGPDDTTRISKGKAAGLPPLSPSLSPRPSMTMTMASAAGSMLSPTSPVSPSFAYFNINGSTPGSRRQSLAVDVTQDSNNTFKTDTNLSPSTLTPSSPTQSPLSITLATSAACVEATTTTTTTTAVATPSTTTAAVGEDSSSPTPKLQKRRSFAQSLKNSMLSLTQLLSPTSSNSSRASSPTSSSDCPNHGTTHSSGGPPHYNILVLGSDSAPLASTLYKMSSLLPGTTSKIRHYQEISGFFVAYFRSNDSFSCSPKIASSEEEMTPHQAQRRRSSDVSHLKDGMSALGITRQGEDEVKSRRPSLQEARVGEDEESWASSRSSEETLLQLKPSLTQSTIAENQTGVSSDNSTANSVKDMDREEVLLSDTEGDVSDTESTSTSRTQVNNGDDFTDLSASPSSQVQPDSAEQLKPSANASLSIHAFSLDTTWPVPRILAQTFWFPFAHGIIYIVDATRKNDPRGVDHLLNARQFLASLVADSHFKRKDIPVVVFANKAGTDPETCYRLDEIAEILGCEDWDVNGSGGAETDVKTGKVTTRPWCVKSTRADGEGHGIRESVEWLKSRMGEIWK